MQYRTYPPDPRLSPYIENYWSLGLHEEQPGDLESCIVPDGNTSLMFIRHPLRRRSVARDSTDRYSDRCLLVGQKTQPVFYSFPAGQWVQTYGVRFRPLGLAAFLGIAQSELRDQIVDAIDLFGNTICHLSNQLQSARTPDGKVGYLNRFFLKQLRIITPQFRLVDQLTGQIFKQKGQLKMADLQEISRVSYRQMDRLFRSYLGLSPKAYARIVRFNHCVFLYRRHHFTRLTDLAYEGGYFDQMHFIKEVKYFTHETPGQYLAHAGRMAPAFDELLTRRFEVKKSQTSDFYYFS
ncbi:AraC family transcriptional regulator [Flavilitoribacter nigricans]|nr:helix-turn-helix domain-containing protein [Flavilitoribacter nigricans]